MMTRHRWELCWHQSFGISKTSACPAVCYCGRDRNTRLAESLTAANELGDRVAEENRVLQQEARARERDSFEVGEYLRQELADRKREDAELKERLAEVQSDSPRCCVL